MPDAHPQVTATYHIAAKFKSSGEYHPLICHLIDVAAVAEALWEDCLADRLRARLQDNLQLDEDHARRWLAFLAGAHDLGKATPVFQAKGSPDGRSAPRWLASAELPFNPREIALHAHDPVAAHGTVTAAHLPPLLTSLFGVSPDAAVRLALITGGHHGIFPSALDRQKARGPVLGEPRQSQPNPWVTARRELTESLGGLLGLSPAQVPQLPSNADSMLLAGFISVADWIGSIDKEGFFPYDHDGANDLTGYLEKTRQRAHAVVRTLHWDAWPPPKATAAFQTLFPKISPRPLQTASQDIAPEVAAPGLVILEAPMGEGKTEVAFYFEDMWNAAGFRGSYIAMPTQASSNQLYRRFECFLKARYPEAAAINLQLLHGHAALEAAVEILKTGEMDPQPGGVDPDGDQEATVGAAEWFTYRKRGLLAPFGVGTIDQALMSVLQVKHGFVRLFGLAGKTVIIDEVHAYDTYMSTLLERLLEWLAALGSPVVMLSATLPSSRGKALVNAYRRGLGHPAEAVLPEDNYPRITWTAAGGVRARTVGSATGRSLGLRWLTLDPDGLAAHLLEQLRDGGCAAVICNTVAGAQEVFRALRGRYAGLSEADRPDLDLFHARFLFKDRREREDRCLTRFGKPAEEGGITEARPFRAILVATQVIEQSLDLDFDLMVSELAPADLLLQRSGRMHRHKRADRRGAPEPVLQVLVPKTDGDGPPTFSRADTYVYDEHILLRTWHALKDRAAIEVPGEVQALIDQVYAEDGAPPDGAGAALAERWQRTWQAMETKREGKEAVANQPLIPSPLYDEEEFFEIKNAELLEDRPDAARVRQARTRDEELPTLQVVWLEGESAGKAAVKKGDKDAIRELLMHSVSLRGFWVSALYGEEFLPVSWRESSLLRHSRLLTVMGESYKVQGGPLLTYDDDLGFVIEFPRNAAAQEVQVD